MRRWALLLAMGLPLAATLDADAQVRQGPPHEWVYGAWTGGLYSPLDADSQACFGSPTVIFTRDVVMRVSSLDSAYRQRSIETVGPSANGLEFRVLPLAAPGARLPPEAGFGCSGNPNILRVERRGPDEISFPDCTDFPAPLKRCGSR